MTNEQALRYWEWKLERAEGWSDTHWEASERKAHKEYVDAMKAVIEALKAPTESTNTPTNTPTEFLISRYDAKDKAKEIMYSILDDTDYNNVESMAHACLMMKIKILKMFDALPSAEPKTKCIAQIRIDREDIENFVNDKVNKIVYKMEEPKTGEWIKATGMMPPEFHGHHCCSECGAFANMDAPFGNREDLSDYCPNCGSFNGGDDK